MLFACVHLYSHACSFVDNFGSYYSSYKARPITTCSSSSSSSSSSSLPPLPLSMPIRSAPSSKSMETTHQLSQNDAITIL